MTTIALMLILVAAFAAVGVLVGYIYGRNYFQKERDRLQMELAAKDQEKLTELAVKDRENQSDLQQLKEQLQKEAERENKKTLESSRAGIKGKVSENLALLIPDFETKYPDLKISEAKFMGEPIDYLFFEGMDDKNITKLVFLEVKSGKHPRYNDDESSLRKVIDDAKAKGAALEWCEYTVPGADLYSATIVENSLADKDILSKMRIEKTWQDGDWTLHNALIEKEQVPALAKALAAGPWYIHLWQTGSDEVIVVFREKVFTIQHSDKSTWTDAIAYGKSIGIPEEQLDFLRV